DMHMPELSGPEVVQRWRFMENGHLPIIMLTADARAEAREACEEAGADSFLTKPVNSRALVEAVVRLTARQAPVAAKPPSQESQFEGIDESVLDELAQLGGAPFIVDLLS